MDLLLFVLAVSKGPVLASELAPVLAKDASNVRSTLTALEREGLAFRTKVGTKGPQGTYRWQLTPSGKACVEPLLAWIASQRLS